MAGNGCRHGSEPKFSDLGLGAEGHFSSPRRSLYTLSPADGEPITSFEAHWADLDQQGRLVATVGGRMLAGKLKKGGKPLWRQLAAMQEEQPTRMEAPEWAQHW